MLGKGLSLKSRRELAIQNIIGHFLTRNIFSGSGHLAPTFAEHPSQHVSSRVICKCKLYRRPPKTDLYPQSKHTTVNGSRGQKLYEIQVGCDGLIDLLTCLCLLYLFQSQFIDFNLSSWGSFLYLPLLVVPINCIMVPIDCIIETYRFAKRKRNA